MRNAIILAAGMGSRLGAVGKTLPKGLIEVAGVALIHRSIAQLRSRGVQQITVVTGHRHELYDKELEDERDVVLVRNRRYQSTGSFESLCIGLKLVQTETLILDSDICYETSALDALENQPNAICVLASGLTGAGDEVWVTGRDERLHALSKSLPSDVTSVLGEFVGISRVSAEAASRLMNLRDTAGDFWGRREYEEALNNLAMDTPVGVAVSRELKWGEIDTLTQLERVRALFTCDSGGGSG